jgi:hypothetical protein
MQLQKNLAKSGRKNQAHFGETDGEVELLEEMKPPNA